jgi:fatty acid-binding protein DegV
VPSSDPAVERTGKQQVEVTAVPSSAFITDTDASLQEDLAARYDIRLVLVNVHFGEENLATGADIDNARLCAGVDREGMLPTTLAPSPGQFAKLTPGIAVHSGAGLIGIAVAAA